MKFSCPKCQAKYQIADEKVIGRTLKMKCRKCGTFIPIQGRATTVDARVSTSRELASRGGKAPTPKMGSPAAKGSAALKNSPAVPRGGLQTRAPRPGAGMEAPAPPVSSKPRSSALSTDRLALSIPAAHAPPPPSVRQYSSGSEAGLPSMPAKAKAQPMPEPEWYVGIGGKIVGPMTKEKLEAKVAAGEVNAESYVWKDGQGEWKPIPDVPEAADVLRAAAAPPSIPMQAKHYDALDRAVEARGASPARSNAQAPTVAGRAQAGAATPTHAAAASATGVQPAGPVPAAVSPPDAAEPAPTLRTAGTVADSDLDDNDAFVVPRRSRSVGTGAIAFAVIVAVGLGVSIGFVLFGSSGQKVIREVIEVPVAAKGESVPAPPSSPDGETNEAGEEEAAADAPSGRVPTKDVARGRSPQPAPAKAEEKGLSGLQGLSGLNAAGPSGPSTSSPSGGGGQELSASQIQSTVAKYQASVKRGCWQPALDSRARNAPSSARVSVSISVAPSGAVTSAKAGGDPSGYPGLASCISRKVQVWRFPASSGSTQVNVPFVFAAQ